VAGAKWAGLHPQGVVGVADKTRGVCIEKNYSSLSKMIQKEKLKQY